MRLGVKKLRLREDKSGRNEKKLGYEKTSGRKEVGGENSRWNKKISNSGAEKKSS